MHPQRQRLVWRIRNAMIGVTVTGVATAVTVIGAPAAHAASDGLEQIAVHQSLLATYTWYRQTYAGIPVLDTYYIERKDRLTNAVTIEDGRAKIADLPRAIASVGNTTALATAVKRAPGAPVKTELVIVPGTKATLAWSVATSSFAAGYRTLVDAASGAVLDVRNQSAQIDGTGTVFEGSNPVTNLQDITLTDQNNTNYAKLQKAYKKVKLTRLNGDGTLRGQYAYDNSPTAVLTHSPSNVFDYDRSNVNFEQVMAYHAITSSQEYIQSLGLTNINNEPQDYSTYGLAADNSHFDYNLDMLIYGTGGVDDAEDREIIWHEYGHAIQFAQIPGWGPGAEPRAIGEGFGDYWAYTMSIPISRATALTPLACIADWDSTSYSKTTPPCIRRVDGNKHYPVDMRWQEHADGEMWSRALFDLHGALGRNLANKIVLEAQFAFTPDITFKIAAQKTVATAKALGGATAEAAATKAFTDRGFL
jgi:Zn-dependent metalloprotease